jgi:hypothetical protein
LAGCQIIPTDLNFHLQKCLEIFDKNSADKIQFKSYKEVNPPCHVLCQLGLRIYIIRFSVFLFVFQHSIFQMLTSPPVWKLLDSQAKKKILYVISVIPSVLVSFLPYYCHFKYLSLWIAPVPSMTSFLTHTVAHSTRPSFRPKIYNQPLKKFLSLAVSWVKVVKNGKILTFKVNFLCQKLSESF